VIIERTCGRNFSRVGWEASSERQSSRTVRSSSGKLRSSLHDDIGMGTEGAQGRRNVRHIDLVRNECGYRGIEIVSQCDVDITNLLLRTLGI
jgi:hypothetical protein